MFALAVIWIIAALCGFAAASVWEPALRLTVGLAGTVDPGLAAYIGEFAALGAGAGTAIGWLVALAIGVPLTLLWLGFRVVAGALRGPDRQGQRSRTTSRSERAHEASSSDRTAPPRHDPLPRPRGSTVEVRRPRSDVPASAPATNPSPAEARPAERPTSSAPDAPRWGRQ